MEIYYALSLSCTSQRVFISASSQGSIVIFSGNQGFFHFDHFDEDTDQSTATINVSPLTIMTIKLQLYSMEGQ